MCSDKLSLLSYHGNLCVLIISAGFINPHSIDYNLIPKIQCMFHKICTVWRETLEGANFGGMARKASLAE